MPYRAEPQPQRLPAVLKDRAGHNRGLPPVTGALQPEFPHGPSARMLATRTPKAVRPAQSKQVVSAGFLGREPRLELHQIARIVLHEPAYYMLGLPESNGYPGDTKLISSEAGRYVSGADFLLQLSSGSH